MGHDTFFDPPRSRSNPYHGTELYIHSHLSIKKKCRYSVKKILQKRLSYFTVRSMNQELKKKLVNNLMQVTRKFAEVETFPIRVTDKINISTREAHALESIGEKQCGNVTEIANYFGFSKSAASQLVSKLTKQGFIIKKQASHSNKELLLSLTPLGWQAFEAHAKMHGQDRKRVLEAMDRVEVDVLIRLNELLNNLNTIMDERLKTK